MDADSPMRTDAARRRSAAWLALALLVLFTPAAGAQTSGRRAAARPVENAYLNLNVGWQGGDRTFSQALSRTLYDETATFDIRHTSSTGLPLDAFVGVRAWKNLSLALGVTRFRIPADANLTGSVPHPLFFGRFRTIEQELAGFEHQQVGVHLQLVWIGRLTDRVDVAFSAGPSLFLVAQDRVADLATQEAAPYDEVQVMATRESVRTEAVGGNAGIDLTYRVAGHLGVGVFVRWTGGTASFPEFGPDQTVTAGGIQSGLGLRFRF